MKLNKKFLWTSLITMLLVSTTIVTMVLMVNVASALPDTHFFVGPPEVGDVTPGNTFLININVTDAPNTFAWTFYISWDPDLLEVFYKKQGDFLHRWEWDPWEGKWVPKYDTSFVSTPFAEANVEGEMMIHCSLIGDPKTVPWASGNGWLASLGFNVTALGSSVLNLHKTRLYDYYIDFETGELGSTYYPNNDGFFYNVDIHDIAVTSVTANTSSVEPGETVSITVTVENEGNFSETFNVTVYADVTVYNMTVDWWPDEVVVGDEITIGTQTGLTLGVGVSTTLPDFTWDTTGVPADAYTISANVTLTSPPDDDPRDNMFIDGTVTFVVDHDLKITDVTVLTPEVLLGELVNVTVNVLNQGTNPESFILYVNASDTIIDTIPDSLNAGANRTYDISWDTTGVAGGLYTISAEVSPVSGERLIDTEDNLLIDGTVRVKIHDLNITDVVVLTPLVYEGELANINVTVLNEGTESENFILYVYANDTYGNETIIGMVLDLLDAGASLTYGISWATTDYGVYTISAEVSPVLDEVDTADNTRTDGTVRVKIPGDVNGDGTVDGSDLAMVDAAYGSESGGPNWDEECDFNGDGKVDVSDLFDLSRNFGRSE